MISRLFIMVILLGTMHQVQAFTFTVTSLNNSGTGTLRQALSFVNNGDSILFSVTGTINITSQLSCTKSIHLIGPGSGSLTIDAGDNSRVFNLNTVGALYISGLTIEDGYVSPGNGLEGGGIYATVDELYLTDIVIYGNTIGSYQSNGQSNIKGGGAYIVSDLLVLTDVEVTSNVSNGRPVAYGGGLYVVSDEVRMYNTTINSNLVRTDQYVGSSTAMGGGAYIDADSIYLDHCNIHNNTLYAESGWQTYNSGNTRGGGLYTTNTTSSVNELIMQNVNIYTNYSRSVGNYSYPYAGGWYGEDHDVVVDSLSMYSNLLYMYDWHDGQGRGYAMYLTGVASFEMTNSEIFNHAYNRTGYDHHVVYVSASGDVNIDYLKAYNNDIMANYSQSIFYLSGANGTIKDAEFYNNNVYSTGTMRTLVTSFTNALDIEQSSFYDNDRAISVDAGDLNLINSTMTANTDDIYSSSSSSTISLVNSTVDGKITAPDMEFENTILDAPTLSGTITSNGGNIINSPSYSSSFTLSSDNNNVNPVLDTLDYHGGNTKVYSVFSFSQAINNGVSNGITTDQRGYIRTGTIDIGAFEYYGTDPNACTTLYTVDTIVACGSYTWIDGNTYTSNDTTAQDSLITSNGCDSIVTLHLTVNQPTASTQTVQACGSYTWIDGNTYYASNSTSTHTVTGSNGCDSVIALDLTIHTVIHQTQFITACDSYTWIDGNTYTASNSTATDTFTSASGCDSILHLNLTVLNSSSSTTIITACDSYTWIDGNTYTSSTNTPTVTMLNSAGCDSVITLDLTIQASSSSTQTIEACGSYTWIDGNTYTSSNTTATYTLTAANGCDSVISLDLTIHSNVHQTQFISACDSYTWVDGNTYISSNTTATDTFPSASGCDSILHLNLTILQSTSGTDVVTACDSYTWMDGNTYTSSTNTPTYTLTNSAGCDSVVTLNLTILNSTTSTDVVEACESYTWIDGNTYTSSNSTATYTLTGSNGCDSVVTLNLTINNNIHQTQFITSCGSYTWIDGNTYTTSNATATATFPSASGCDSILYLNLTILNTSAATDVITSCDRYTWIDGNTYTTSTNTPTVTLLNSAGCDSVVTLDLTIVYSTSSTDSIEACESYTWIDGKTYTSSNTSATHTIFNSSGCDSVIHLDLTIHDAESTLFDTVIIEGDTVTVGTSQYTEAGVYTDLFTSVHGCDSVVTTVIHTQPNGIDEWSNASISVYPNPTRGMFTIEGKLENGHGQIRILNSVGQAIEVFRYNTQDLNQQVDLTAHPNGVYFMELSDGDNRGIQRIVKAQ